MLLGRKCGICMDHLAYVLNFPFLSQDADILHSAGCWDCWFRDGEGWAMGKYVSGWPDPARWAMLWFHGPLARTTPAWFPLVRFPQVWSFPIGVMLSWPADMVQGAKDASVTVPLGWNETRTRRDFGMWGPGPSFCGRCFEEGLVGYLEISTEWISSAEEGWSHHATSNLLGYTVYLFSCLPTKGMHAAEGYNVYIRECLIMLLLTFHCLLVKNYSMKLNFLHFVCKIFLQWESEGNVKGPF